MTHTVEQPLISYEHIIGEIPDHLESGQLITVQRNSPLKIYSLGFQPAKFIPEIPRWFLKKYATSSYTILDPFCGSGTTFVFQYFEYYAKQAIEALSEWNPFLINFTNQIQELSCQDARHLPKHLKVDAIVTSPPYINAIDYVWASN